MTMGSSSADTMDPAIMAVLARTVESFMIDYRSLCLYGSRFELRRGSES